MSNIIPIGSLVKCQTSKRSKTFIGRVKDMDIWKVGIRYSIEREYTGMFLNGELNEAFDKEKMFVKDTRWCFFMWMKPERIIKIIELKTTDA